MTAPTPPSDLTALHGWAKRALARGVLGEGNAALIRDLDAALSALARVVKAAREVKDAVVRVGLGEQGAIGALYLTGNTLRSALDALDALARPEGEGAEK